MEAVKIGAATFDWNTTSEQWGTPLLAIMVGKFFSSNKATYEAKVKMMTWCIAQGADPHAHAPLFCSWEIHAGMLNLRHGASIIGGHSAVSIVSMLIHKNVTETKATGYISDESEADFEYEKCQKLDQRLRQVYDLLVFAERGPAKVHVLEGVASLWENIYKDRATADVVFFCNTTSGQDQKECRAHSLVLKAASPVLSAMLDSESAWQEGQNRKIEVGDTVGVVEHFISLIYTGCFAEGQMTSGIEPADVIEIAELAQRYQVDFLISGLIHHLHRHLSDANFDSICSFALRHGEKDLQRDCRDHVRALYFGDMSKEAWDVWFASLSPEVQAFVSRIIGLQTQKRQRRCL
eukprot:TRINITY_DN56721_c0_g1_i1.p1 TRINITY_DN56721_c0_g1~~TRINITY_DN56721_c0_g1_i1.p1  ORF type:complete len:383 (+),score=62.05 TRINITY_DN56721_c0_g1_i1:100-1149(+)